MVVAITNRKWSKLHPRIGSTSTSSEMASTWQPSTSTSRGGQTAGLSTAESDAATASHGSERGGASPNEGGDAFKIDGSGAGARHRARPDGDDRGDAGLVNTAPATPSPPPPKPKPASPPKPQSSPMFPKSPKPKGKSGGSRADTSSSHDEGSFLNRSRSSSMASLSNSAPTVLVTTTSSGDPALRRPLRSAMSSRTLHESLHRGRPPAASGARRRSISFAQVHIREYERVLGDNPSVRSGPPLSIGWRHAPDPISMTLDDYEEGRGEPRSSAEYLVPKRDREDLLKEQAGVRHREMIETIRAVNKEKQRRRKTVINLGMMKSEERVEGAKRKIKKILKPSSSYKSREAKLWDDAHAAAVEKARRLEDSMRRGESVGRRDLYRVGTPFDNLLPSRSNSMSPRLVQPQNPLEDAKNAAAKDSCDGRAAGEHLVSPEAAGAPCASKPIAKAEAEDPDEDRLASPEHRGAGEGESSASGIAKAEPPAPSSAGGEEEAPSEDPLASSRRRGVAEGESKAGGSIVAVECESEEVFAKLVLDA